MSWAIQNKDNGLWVKGQWCNVREAQRDLFVAKEDAKAWLKEHVLDIFHKHFEIIEV